jgi:hypothetical protein
MNRLLFSALVLLCTSTIHAQIIGSPEHKIVIETLSKNPGQLELFAKQYNSDSFGKCLAVNNLLNIATIRGEIKPDQTAKFMIASDFEALARARRLLLGANIRQETLDSNLKRYTAKALSSDKEFSQMITECIEIRKRGFAN